MRFNPIELATLSMLLLVGTSATNVLANPVNAELRAESGAKSFNSSAYLENTQSLIKKGEYIAASQYLQPLMDEYLGDPAFDFYYGIALIATHEYDLAVFSFERVVSNEPTWIEAKYYLALAYFKSNNFQETITLLEQLKSTPLANSSVSSRIDSLLSKAQFGLSKQSMIVTQRLSLGVGYDSNVNAGSSEDRIFLPLLGEDILLSDQSKETSDRYSRVNYSLSANKALSQKQYLDFQVGINTVYFDDHGEYNRTGLNGGLGYNFRNNNTRYRVGVNSSPLWLDGNYYRINNGAMFSVKHDLNNRWVMLGGLEYSQTDNNQNSLLDTNQTRVNAGIEYLTRSTKYAAVVDYEQERSERSESDHISRDISSATLSSISALAPNWWLSVMLSYQYHDYQGLHPYYLMARNDDFWLLGSTLNYQVTNQTAVSLSANWQDKESNLDLFSYERADIGLSFEARF